jgi:hypothetical protein
VEGGARPGDDTIVHDVALECSGAPPLCPSASLLAVISAWGAIPASKLVPPSGKSGSKLPHSKTTDSRSHHQKLMVTITRAS